MLAVINSNIVAMGSHKNPKKPKFYPRPKDKGTKYGNKPVEPKKLRKMFSEKRKTQPSSSLSLYRTGTALFFLFFSTVLNATSRPVSSKMPGNSPAANAHKTGWAFRNLLTGWYIEITNA